MPAAILILSDPQSGSEEALGRAFNGLSAAYDFQQKGEAVTILFLGAGARWAPLLVKPDHPFHGLYQSVREKVAGVSCGCADVFGAGEEARAAGFQMIWDNPVPGTSGLPSLEQLVRNGFTILSF